MWKIWLFCQHCFLCHWLTDCYKGLLCNDRITIIKCDWKQSIHTPGVPSVQIHRVAHNWDSFLVNNQDLICLIWQHHPILSERYRFVCEYLIMLLTDSTAKQSLDTETNIRSPAACFVPLLGYSWNSPRSFTFSFCPMGVTVNCSKNSVNVIVCISMFYVVADIKLGLYFLLRWVKLSDSKFDTFLRRTCFC